MNDLELLRRFEPIVRYTQGEMFFPCEVGPYVRRCSLWARKRERPRGRGASLVVPAGALDLERLARCSAPASDMTLYLRLVEQPVTGRAYQQWRRTDRPEFQAPGRLARVGLASRFADAFFSLSLLLRGTVPGGTVAAAERQYQAIFTEVPHYTYYGRVVRQDGYIVLNYHFFYVMNDWRSSFAGVNDHESDWEQIFVFLAKGEDGEYAPAWLAYASHDNSGDDLRRRWDDPDLSVEGTHPVVYAGAGSHAAYFQPGEYVTSVELKYLAPVYRAFALGRRIWRDVLRQGEPGAFVERIEALLRVPFVDYARGDGRAIGPGQADEWSPVVIDDESGWVSGYRGLWGLDTEDVLSGETAPAGPKYTRQGTVRESWYDPLGWSGLSKVPPPAASIEVLSQHLAELEAEQSEIDVRIGAVREDLLRLDLEARAMQGVSHLREAYAARCRRLSEQEAELRGLTARRLDLVETRVACAQYLHDLKAGFRGDPHAHLQHVLHPEPPGSTRRGRIIEVWAALSTGLLILGGVVLLLAGVNNAIVALGMLIATVVLVENILHGRLERLLLNVTIGLALATTLVLVYEFFWQVSLAAVAAIAALILVDNIGELRGR